MDKHLVKLGRKILGFVYQDKQGVWWYAFGKPSQSSYISFACASLKDGQNKINGHAAL